jgi:Tfp pilus assembly protein PilO
MKLGFLSKLPKGKLQKVVLVSILILGATGGAIQFYVVRNWKAVAETANGIATVKGQISQAEDIARQAVREKAYRDEVRSFVETQQTMMIDGDPFAWVVREITLLAEKHPIHIEGLHAGSKIELSANAKFQPYSTRIDFVGSYDEIGEFVRDLETRFPTSEIRTLSVSAGAEDPNRQEASLELILRIRAEQASANVEGKKAS